MVNRSPEHVLQELAEAARGAGASAEASCPGAFSLTGNVPGPQVLISAIIHGNEPCGYGVLLRLFQAFADKSLRLTAGKLTLVAANIAAFCENKQQIHDNLNRLFRDDHAVLANSLEHQRAAELRPLYARASHLLDLHATTAPTIPFLMCEAAALPTAQLLGISPIVIGWGELGDASTTGDTETYCNSHGGQGMTLECGQRDWLGGAEFGFKASLQFLSACGVTLERAPVTRDTTVFQILSVFSVRAPGFVYRRNFRSFDEVRRGECLGMDEQGEVYATEDCVMLMPANPAERTLGQDLFLLARAFSPSQ